MRQTVALEENVRVSVDGENISDPRFLERTYQEAMALVVEIAAYLKNAGKTPEISTDKKINMAYSVESMRMTSALMLVVSWLMVRLAENRGEISTEESMEDDKLLGAREICLARRPMGQTSCRNISRFINTGSEIYSNVLPAWKNIY